ncbi:Short transient receptor potential channel 2 like protein [Chelonia mydas]|uniref:Short transient receptor potential channel 2 like protein n=1 Tax=Chelonia mydas TaxID=8469 RepID=M7ATA0_CHEMY|nr:Short transient receptor potential channel 2 like protein [Chelonia mydas]
MHKDAACRAGVMVTSGLRWVQGGRALPIALRSPGRACASFPDLGNRITELNKSVSRLHAEVKCLHHSPPARPAPASPLDGASPLHRYILRVQDNFQNFSQASGSSGPGSPAQVMVHQDGAAGNDPQPYPEELSLCPQHKMSLGEGDRAGEPEDPSSRPAEEADSGPTSSSSGQRLHGGLEPSNNIHAHHV